MAIDTACSASLVAAALAHKALAAGELVAAAVAGVHVQATRTSSSYVWAAGMLSPQGRCQVRAGRASRGGGQVVAWQAYPNTVAAADLVLHCDR